MEPNPHDARDVGEILIPSEHLMTASQRHCCNEAVDESPRRAPAATSMTIGSLTAMGQSVAMSSFSARSTGLPVARSYSAQAELSTRITRRRLLTRRPAGSRWREPRAWPRLPRGTSGRPPSGAVQCEVDGLRLRGTPKTLDDRVDVVVLDLDGRARPRHTPIVHVQRPASTCPSSARCRRTQVIERGWAPATRASMPRRGVVRRSRGAWEPPGARLRCRGGCAGSP